MSAKKFIMKKSLLVFYLVITILLGGYGFAQAQMSSDKNTITLPNGDLIWDLNGEWVVLVEPLGKWAQSGIVNYATLWKITQTGNSFVAVTMTDDKYYYKDSERARGELDKNGIRKVTALTYQGPIESKGRIDYDGNKIIIENDVLRFTTTRKR